jgi:acetoin utilization deacetylase AcuC-like enzyme
MRPDPATEDDILLAHTKPHVASIKQDRFLFEIASLAAGGAILAAKSALDGEPCFGLIRPPGHHASPGSCWGFCFFNNIAISLLKVINERAVESAVILDFDLHFGDGTENIFSRYSRILYLHPEERSSEAFLQRAREGLEKAGQRDILAISAGFDRGRRDWGDLLDEQDYRTLGVIARDYAVRCCNGRRYAVLEGGYNHAVLGRHALAFLEGLK